MLLIATIFIIRDLSILDVITISCLIFAFGISLYGVVKKKSCYNHVTEESYKDQLDSYDANRIRFENPLSRHKFHSSCANSRKVEQWDEILGPNFFFPRDRSSYVKPDEIITADLRTS